MMENNQDLELNIADYLKIIWRHKWVILLITIVTTAIIFLPALNKKPIYECSALISPATINGQLVEKIEITNLVLQQEPTLLELANELKIPTEKAYLLTNQFQISPKNDIVEIKSFGSTPEEAKKITDTISNFILNQQEKLIKETYSLLNEQIKNNELLIKELGAKIKNIEWTNNQSQGQIATSYINNLITLKIRRDDLQNQLNQIQKPYLVTHSFLPLKSNPVNKKNGVAIGVLLGLFIGIFYAFLADSFVKNKKKV